ATGSRLKPGSSLMTLTALGGSRVAPTSNGSANAICAATPTLRAAERLRPEVDDRPPSFVMVVTSDPHAWTAGAILAAQPARASKVSENATTGALSAMLSTRGNP